MAELLAPAFCMSCGGLLTERVRFRWGALPECYRAGEAVRWWRLQDGSVYTPFRLLAGDDPRWNFGDPACANVLVFDEDVTDAPRGIQCPICGFVYDGLTIRIEGGAVHSAAPAKLDMITWLRGGAVGPVKAFEVRPCHTHVVREDWYGAAQTVRDV